MSELVLYLLMVKVIVFSMFSGVRWMIMVIMWNSICESWLIRLISGLVCLFSSDSE